MSPSVPAVPAFPAADSSQESLHAAVSAAGPGGRVCAPSSSDSAGLRLRMAVAGLVNVRDGADASLVGDVPSHALGAAAPLQGGASDWAAAAAGAAGELVDEDELLERDGVGVGEGAGEGCAVDEDGKRKPCKDCSCGLADMDGNEKVQKKEPGKGCGSCALGDAFRCAGCPYLGLPPFKPGERVELPTSLMTSDI